MRGTPVGGLDCPAASAATGGTGVPGSVSVPASQVSSVVLCPLTAPSSTGSPVTIGRSDPRFAPLVSALSLPDETMPPGQHMCAMYADLVQVVLAATPSGDLRLHVPVDGCGHYLPSALRLLNADR